MSIGVVLSVAIALGLVVFFHEFGHFLLCKLVGIRVLRFAFGFGPEIFGVTRGATRYSLCAFPLGGFVKPAGEDPEEMTGAADEFFAASWRARIGVALAGPAMNYLFSFLVFWLAFSFFGLPDMSHEPVIGTVFGGSPAAAVGLKPKDRILDITTKEGKTRVISSWQELAGFIHSHPQEALKLRLERDKASFEVSITPEKEREKGIGLIGIGPATLYAKVNPLRACVLSFNQVVRWTTSTLGYLWEKMTQGGKLDLAGPVGIVQMMGKAARSGWDDFLGLLAVVSIAIGLFNLFPIPLLDGGHVLFYIWEAISRRKLTRKFLMRGNTVGLVILIPIFLFAFYNDMSRIWTTQIKKVKTEFQEIIKK